MCWIFVGRGLTPLPSTFPKERFKSKAEVRHGGVASNTYTEANEGDSRVSGRPCLKTIARKFFRVYSINHALVLKVSTVGT